MPLSIPPVPARQPQSAHQRIFALISARSALAPPLRSHARQYRDVGAPTTPTTNQQNNQPTPHHPMTATAPTLHWPRMIRRQANRENATGQPKFTSAPTPQASAPTWRGLPHDMPTSAGRPPPGRHGASPHKLRAGPSLSPEKTNPNNQPQSNINL